MTKLNNIKILLLLLILTLVTLAVYFNAFTVPFYLDDFYHLRDNNMLKEGSLQAILEFQRPIGVLSFWANFQLGFDSLIALHATNIIIHIINALLVFLFVKALFITPILKQHPLAKYHGYIALLVAFIFAVHPLHTQAVTYLVQRFASLALVFYLLSLICYIKARVSASIPIAGLWLIASIAAMLLAFLTKQNAVTLVGVLMLIEVYLFASKRLAKWLIYGGILAVIAALAIWQFDLFTPYLAKLDKLTTETERFTRLEYLFSQFSVLTIYIGKVFFPFPLRLEYGYAPADFSTLNNLLSLCFLVGLLALAYRFRAKNPLLLFGVLFYFIAHGVESSIIPIKDIIVEHRTYIPNVGLLIALVSSVFIFVNKPQQLKVALGAFAVVAVALAITASYRNAQWQNPRAFYEYELSLNPNHKRLSANLAKVYLEAGDLQLGIAQLEKTIELKQGQIDEDLANNLIAAAIEAGNFKQAQKIADGLLPNIKNSYTRSQVLTNLGVLHLRKSKLAEAESYFKQALAEPWYLADTHFAIAVVYFQTNRFALAKKHISLLLEKKPRHQEGLRMKKLLISQGY